MSNQLMNGAFPQYMNPMGADYYLKAKQISEGQAEGFDQNNFFTKALTSTAGSGGEVIPEGYSAKIIWELYEQNFARQLFGTWVVTQGVKENIPKFSSELVEASGVSNAVDALPSELTSTTSIAKATMTSTEVEIELKTLAIRLEVQNKVLAYNVQGSTQFEGELKRKIAAKMAATEEDMLINGDTETSSASNMNYTYNDSSHTHGVNTADGNNQHLLLFNGLRKQAGATDVDASSGAWTSDDFATAFKNLGVFSTKGREKLSFIVSPDLYALMLTWAEIQTMEKYGPNATIVTGEVFKIFGTRVIVTDKMPNTVSGTLTASTGLRAASANSYTEFLCVYNEAVILGVSSKAERTFNIKKKEWPEFDRTDLIAIEDFGVAIKWTGAICRGINGTA